MPNNHRNVFLLHKKDMLGFPQQPLLAPGKSNLPSFPLGKGHSTEPQDWGGSCRTNKADHISKENSAPNKLKLIAVTAENIKHLPG